MRELLPNTKSYLTRFFAAPFEVRAILEGDKINRVYSTVRDDWATGWNDTRKSIANINESANVFISLNPICTDVASNYQNRNGNLKVIKRGEGIRDNDIVSYRWLLIDIDPVRGSDTQNVSSSDAEKEEAWKTVSNIREFLHNKGFYPPVICDSGNGYHLHYRINLENTVENRALVRGFLLELSNKFTNGSAKVDKSVFNPARIIKMYGTFARKGENDSENGRPHRKSGFIEFPKDAELKINGKDVIESVAGKIEISKRVESTDSLKQEERVEWVRNFLDENGVSFWEESNRSGEIKIFFEDGCPFDPSHKRKDAYICIFPSGKTIFKCLHESCSGYGWHDFIRLFDPDHTSFEEKSKVIEDQMKEFFGEEITTPDEPKPVKAQLAFGKNGVLQTMENYIRALTKDSRLSGMFGTNEVTGLPENRHTGESWSDVDDIKVYAYLEKTYGLTKWDACVRAINLQHSEYRFNPITEMLDNLKWDGVKRIESSLSDYLSAEESDYNRGVAKMLFIGAVQRAYEPGCKFDNMVVLLGPQGCGKSTFVKRMALQDTYFSDSVRAIGNKEGAEQLRGAWIVEWGEMSAMRRAQDAEVVKLFISQQYDRYRPPYGRRIVEFPRRCIFVGTTNDPEFLTDRSGNRRFFPVIVDRGVRKNVWHKNADSEFIQMMAEAVFLYKSGERVESVKHIEEAANELRSMCVETDSREGIIGEWLSIHTEVNTVCVRSVWDYVLREDSRFLTTKESRNIGRIINNLEGWVRRGSARIGSYGVQKAWVRKGHEHEEVVWKPEIEES